MKELTFSSGTQVKSEFGSPLIARRKTLVTRRDTKGVETFSRSYGDLTASEGVDYVLVPIDGSDPYPCKINVFSESWEETAVGSEVYQRKALAKVVPVPRGVLVTLKTLEGDVNVSYPDFIAIGVKDEVYVNRKGWVEENLEFLTTVYEHNNFDELI